MIFSSYSAKKIHIIIGNFLAFFLLGGYTFLRSFFLYHTDGFQHIGALLIIMGITAIALSIIIILTKNVKRLAFFVPSTIATGHFFVMLFTGAPPYFFIFLTSLVALCGIYRCQRHFWPFIAYLNLLVLATLLVPDSGVNLGYNLMLEWSLFLFIIVGGFVIAVYSNHRQGVYKLNLDNLNVITSTTPNIELLIDKDTRVIYVSNEFTALSKLAKPEMAKGLFLLDLFDNPELVEMLRDALDAEGRHHGTAKINKDGATHHYSITCVPNEADTGGRFINIIDLTDIISAKEEAEKASKAKSDFLSKMSHEIRTPMNAITGMTELISYEDISPTVAEYVGSIGQAGNHLLSIINDILDFSKVESGMMQLVCAPYYFHSLVNDVISIIKMRMRNSAVEFSVYVSPEIPDELYGDDLRIRQILINILGNAVKYTKTGSISLEITGKIISDGLIDIVASVEDTGIGIKQEDMNQLFDEFAQFDLAKNRGSEGTGLGLPITFNLVKLMNGNILARSNYGEGSVFTIILPQEFRQKDSITIVEEPQNKSVLLYCCSPINTESLKRSLKDLRINYYVATTDLEAYYQLSDKTWNFIFVQPKFAENARKAVQSLGLDTHIILISNSWQISRNFFGTIVMPTYYLNVANVLNSDQRANYDKGRRRKEGFVAPDAKVLVVDDIDTNLKVADGLLRRYGLQVSLCPGGLEAIEAVRLENFDLVLMDHMMPGVDGIEALNVIRMLDDGRFKDLPIVVLTANAIAGTREMFMEEGFDDFLSKPIDASKLYGILEKWIPKELQITKSSADDDEENQSVNHQKPTGRLEIDGIDIAAGIAMCGGDLENYISILRVFHNDGLQKIKQLETSVSDIKLYTTYIHAIKSASANVGATQLSTEAAALENAGIRNDDEYILSRNVAFIQNLERILDNIKRAIDRGNNKNSEINLDTNFVSEHLSILLTALTNLDSGAIDSASHALQKFSQHATIGPQLQEILAGTLIGEYENAIEDIEILMQNLTS